MQIWGRHCPNCLKYTLVYLDFPCGCDIQHCQTCNYSAWDTTHSPLNEYWVDDEEWQRWYLPPYYLHPTSYPIDL